MKIQQKEKKNFRLVLQLSSVELLYLQRKKKKQDYVQNAKNTSVPTSRRDQNSKQLRAEVAFIFSTRTHAYTAWWGNISAKPQWGNRKQKRSASSGEQQSPAIAAFTTTFGNIKRRNPFQELEERVCIIFFLSGAPSPRSQKNSATIRLPTSVVSGAPVSSARRGGEGGGPGDARRRLCTASATHRRWLRHGNASLGRWGQINPSSATGVRCCCLWSWH